jgi:syntaxin 7
MDDFMQEQDYDSLALLEEREQGIKEIESAMSEVNEIYRDLSTLIAVQGTQLDNIEANMTSTEEAVTSGTALLGKASRYQKKARNKMCYVLLIAVIALAILIIILVTSKIPN